MSNDSIEPVVTSVDVPAEPDRTFDYFVEDIAAWWPLQVLSVIRGKGGTPAGARIEPFAGGRIVEVGEDGAEESWGHVGAFERPLRLAFSWQVNAGPSQLTHVEVRFQAVDNGRTRVTLVHDGWQAWGDEGAGKRDQYAAGWTMVLADCFAPGLERNLQDAP